MSEYKCKKCGWTWIARTLLAPKQCPRCKRYGYENPEIKKTQLNNEEVKNEEESIESFSR